MFTETMCHEVRDCINAVRRETRTRVLVLTGAGDKFFCIGGRKEGMEDSTLYAGVLPTLEIYESIERLQKPVIASVNGFAVGGGQVLQVMCDLTIAKESAVFRQVGPMMGSFDAGYGTWYLEDLVGKKKAKEMWFLNPKLTAREALEIGLINKVVPDDKLEEETRKMAEAVAERGAFALAALKGAFGARHGGVGGSFARDARSPAAALPRHRRIARARRSVPRQARPRSGQVRALSTILTLHDPQIARRYYAEGHWREDTLYSLMRQHAKVRPHAYALRDSRRRLTWHALAQWVDAFAADLHAAGLKRGQRVSVWLPNRVESAVVLLACSRNGYVCNPSLHQNYTVADIVQLVERIQSAALVAQPGYGADAHRNDVFSAARDLPSMKRIYALGVHTGEPRTAETAQFFQTPKREPIQAHCLPQMRIPTRSCTSHSLRAPPACPKAFSIRTTRCSRTGARWSRTGITTSAPSSTATARCRITSARSPSSKASSPVSKSS